MSRVRCAFVVLAALAVVVRVASAHAEHGEPWLSSVPSPGEALPTNGVLVLFSENGPVSCVITPRTCAFRLNDGGHTVSLRPTESAQGADFEGYGESHVVLRPRRRLEPNRSYWLEVRARGEASFHAVDVAAPVEGPNALYGGPQAVATWTTSNADVTAPTTSGPATEDRDEYDVLRVRVRATDASPLSIRVVARDATGHASVLRTHHAPIFSVHEGCDTLLLDGTAPWSLTLDVIDAAGHRVRVAGGPIHAQNELVSICLDP